MKNIFFLVFLIFMSCCRKDENLYKDCNFPEATTNGHLLMIPVRFSPHQVNYTIGDTLHIDATFSDSIFDYSTKHTFLVQNFPFDVGVKLYRFENDTTWENGLLVNPYIIDPAYVRKYSYGADGGRQHVDVLYVDFVEEDNLYKFDMKIVLNKKGRYVFQFTDYIVFYPNHLHNELKIDEFPFEGRCLEYGVIPVCMVQGDDQMEHFVPELLYIDNFVFVNGYKSIKKKHSHETPFGTGTWFWEFEATYCFEVK